MQWMDDVDFIELSRENDINHLVFTANAVTIRGNLVMGAGAALCVKNAFAGVDERFGKALDKLLHKDYHVLSVFDANWLPNNIHALQVKRHYRDDGDIELCRQSLRRLADVLDGQKAVLNCPLVGRGGFASRSTEVYEMIETELCDANVFVTRMAR